MFDFFFDLRRAIVVPPAIQSKKEQPRPIASEEARQSPNRDNRSGCKNTVRLLHLYSIKLAVSSECAVACTRHAGLCQKSSYSLKALYLLFQVLMSTKISLVIYSFGSFFQLPDGNFRQSEGRMRGFPAVCTGILVEKYPFAVYIKVGCLCRNQDLEQYELSDNSILAGIH